MQRDAPRYRTRENMRRYAEMFALGATTAAIATKLQVAQTSLFEWKRRWPKIWSHDYRKAIARLEAGQEKIDAEAPALPVEEEYDPRKVKPAAGMLIADFLRGVYLPSRLTMRPSSVRQLESTIRAFGNWLDRPPLVEDLTTQAIRSFLMWYAGGVTDAGRQISPSTVNAKRCQLLAIARCAFDEGVLPTPPQKVRRAAEMRKAPQAWNFAEVERIVRAAAGQTGKIAGIPAGQWWLSLILALYDTGARISAMLSVGTRDADLDGLTLLIRPEHQKDKRGRYCAISDQTARAIGQHLARTREKVWPWPNSPNWLVGWFRRICKEAGVTVGRDHGGSFHKMRRSSGTIAEKNGGDGSALLGNQRTIFERHYLDPRAVRRREIDLLPRPQL